MKLLLAGSIGVPWGLRGFLREDITTQDDQCSLRLHFTYPPPVCRLQLQKQIGSELDRVSRRVGELATQVDKRASKDTTPR